MAEITSPLKAIRSYCLSCVCGSAAEVKACPSADCALYPFRFGRNPFRQARVLTEQERAELAERLKNARKSAENVDG